LEINFRFGSNYNKTGITCPPRAIFTNASDIFPSSIYKF